MIRRIAASFNNVFTSCHCFKIIDNMSDKTSFDIGDGKNELIVAIVTYSHLLNDELTAMGKIIP